MERTITLSVDAWADQAIPAKNHGGAPALRLRGTGTSVGRRAFAFVAPPFPLGATVTAATLKLYVLGTWASGTVTVQRITASWREATVTWADQPASTATNQATAAITGGVDGQEVSFNVTSMLADVAAGGAFYGFRLSLDTDSLRAFHSAEAPVAAYRPVLDVTWGVTPDAPDNLTPAGGRAVSIAKPVLAWEFGDRYGDDADTTFIQVQIDDVNTFTTPDYDSGWVAHSEESWDTSATAWAGITAGQTRYWRVRARDEDGNTSAWSDIQSFTRVAKGVVAITSPTATVPETTPPVVWTVTGATQVSRQIELFRIPASGSPFELIHFEPRRKTTSLTWTIPEKLLHSGDSYAVTVKVWDGTERAGTPGDAVFAAASQFFTYVRNGSPTSPTDLAAAQVGISPAVEITWSRAAAPDYFSLRVDGREIEPRIPFADVLVSGDDYAYTYWGVPPDGEAHVIEIEAVVLTAGKLYHSDANPTVNVTIAPAAIWLVDQDDGTYVKIGGPSTVDLEIKEEGETFSIFGSRNSVRITSSVGGYAGSVSGFVTSGEVATFLELKGRLTNLRLIVGNLSIPIYLEAVTDCTPDGELPGASRYSVSFDCFQAGEFNAAFEVAGG